MRAQRFDLVLMDCQMPELDGYAATVAWRQEEARRLLPRTPVVALTASAVDDDRARCLASGMDGFLVKPFEMDELLAVVTQHLRGPAASPSGQAAPPAAAAA
ncbi:response regulator [Mitsuaria sp. TWR114]|uniref:response regulator n=1 Tax=Mitsuaria sp. TWR114 TaxID=2601731 RepID=UPI002107696E|nr:response regulator [Mitsuaria sp. TWR114]